MLSMVVDRIRDASAVPVYAPLNDVRTIRLLQLIPDSSPGSPGFRLVLQHFNLDKAPSFDLLSYTRSSPKYSKAITDEWKAKSKCEEFSDWEKEVEEVSKNEDQPAKDPVFGFLSNALQQVTGQATLAPTSIRVNDGRVTVHEDVYSFLRFAYHKHMYRPQGLSQTEPDSKHDLKQEEVFLWIDNICLNQRDTSELARQCPLLGTIYKHARQCLVWLSEHEPPPGVGWVMNDFAPKCIQVAEEKGPDFVWKEDAWGRGTEMKDAFGEETVQKWRANMLHYWTLIARHEYFTEGWLQEVVLTNNVKVICGNEAWDWMILERFTILTAPVRWALGGLGYTKLFQALFTRWSLVTSLMKNCSSIRRWWLSGSDESRRQDLAKIFGPLNDEQRVYCQVSKLAQHVRRQRFEHKRDHVYGWLGLTQLCLPPGKTFGSPTYTLPASAAYVRFAKALIKGMPALDLLNHVEDAGMRKLQEKLPSWVPDFSVNHSHPLLRFKPEIFDTRFDATRVRTEPSANRTAVCDDGATLVVNAVPLDVILRRGQRLRIGWHTLHLNQAEWFLERCLETERYKPTGQSIQEALCLTLVAGGLENDSGTRSRESFDAFWAGLLNGRRKSLSTTDAERLLELVDKVGVRVPDKEDHWIPESRERLDEWADKISLGDEKDLALFKKQRHPVMDMASKTWSCRAPLVTRDGHLGLCGASVKAGDGIWLLEGGRTPYVLRKLEGGGFRFMGEAYVHGFMHGEGWTEEAKKKMRRVKIV